MKAIKITMRYRKSTPHTYVFEEVDMKRESLKPIVSSIPTLYIHKNALTELAQEIKVTVEVIK